MSAELEPQTGAQEVLDPGKPNSNGHHPQYASVDDILLAAPKDIREQDVSGVFDGKVIRVRGLTAAQVARVKQDSITVQGNKPQVDIAQMERLQFEMGVINPRFRPDQVLMLHRMAGPSFTRVIEVLDELSGTNKEALRDARAEFPE